jgi:hypothetical protein
MKANKQERAYMGRVAELGCVIVVEYQKYITTRKTGATGLNQVIMI